MTEVKKEFIFDPELYFVVCRDCPHSIRLPFSSFAKRFSWCRTHTHDTGHMSFFFMSIRTEDWLVSKDA